MLASAFLPFFATHRARTDSLEKINAPVFVVTLKVRTTEGTLKDIAFSASFEEMTDLVARLKDAVAALERVDLM